LTPAASKARCTAIIAAEEAGEAAVFDKTLKPKAASSIAKCKAAGCSVWASMPWLRHIAICGMSSA
jgi:hypothetical protein